METVESKDNGHVNQSTKQTYSAEKIQKNELWGEGPMRIVGHMEKGWFVTLGQFKISDTYTTEENLKKCVDYDTVKMMITIALATIEQSKQIENEQIANNELAKSIISRGEQEIKTKPNKHTIKDELTPEERQFHKHNNQRHIKDRLADLTD